MAAPSEIFYQRTTRKSVYNIQPISNISSVIKQGILSYKKAGLLKHKSIAMQDVQNKRDNIILPSGRPLHSYASLYFTPRNPMMYRRKDIALSLCVLAVSSSVLDINGTIVTDGNAASPYSRIYPASEGVQMLDFSIIYNQWWIDNDMERQAYLKRTKCAEILVPDSISYDYIVGAVVVNKQALIDLQNEGFQKEIIIHPNVFFWSKEQ